MKGSDRGGFLGQFSIWASLGASLYLMPFGALLVPALSIEQALLATVLAAFIGALLIASIAALAAGSGRSTADLLTEPLGEAGRIPVSVLLLLRHVLFATLALALIADAAALISERSLGAGLRPLWVLVFGLAGLGLVFAGQQRVFAVIRRFGVWLVLLVAVVIAASAYMEFEIPAYLRRPALGGWPSFWQALDIMLVFPLLWLPVVADLSRSGTDSRSAARGSFAGIFLTTVWFGALGILYLPATDSGDIPGFLVGMQLGLGAMVLLLLLQADELYVSAIAAAPAFKALRDSGPAALAPAGALILAAPLAVLLNVGDLEAYVLLAAALFVPAFGVVIAQALFPARESGLAAVAAWLCGFVLYQWIAPAEIGWWQDAFSAPFDAVGLPFALSDEVTWLGAAIPSFLLAFGIAAAVPRVARLLFVRSRPVSSAA